MPRILGIDRVEFSPDKLGGTIPIGAVIPVMSHLAGSYSLPSSGAAVNGFMRCDGAAIPGSQVLNGNTPDLTSGRFIYGTSGSGSGANFAAGTVGGNASNQVTLSTTNLPGHTHGVGTLANAASSVSVTGNKNQFDSNQSNSGNHQHTTYARNHMPGGPSGLGNTSWTGNIDIQYNFSDPTSLAGAHTHTWTGTFSATGTANAQAISGNTGSTGDGTAFSILPLYVTAVYLIRVA